MSDIMPTEPILVERWRGNAILAWLDSEPILQECALLRRSVANELDALKDAKTYDDYTFSSDSPVTERYLVLKLITYNDGHEREVDAEDWASCRTLEEAKAEVEEHVFSAARPDYENLCRVFDTSLRREQPWHEVRYAEWGDRPGG